jgi:hypothetical protein
MNFRFLSILFIFAFSLSISAGATEELLQKVYILAADVQMTDQGIYLDEHNGGFLLVDAVFSDHAGLYVIKPSVADDRCTNQHDIWCRRCLGCAVAMCKFRCRCVEWPFQSVQ